MFGMVLTGIDLPPTASKDVCVVPLTLLSTEPPPESKQGLANVGPPVAVTNMQQETMSVSDNVRLKNGPNDIV